MSDRRRLIEQEALRLFAQKGVGNVSTRELAHAVGIGESGLYRHMDSKEELALRVFGQAYKAFAHDLRAAVASSHDGFAGAVLAIVTTIYASFDNDPVLLRFLVLRQHDTMADLDLGEDNPVAVVFETVEAAFARGEIAGMDAEVALALLMGVVLQPMTNTLYARLSGPVSQHTRAVTQAALRALNCTTTLQEVSA